MLRNLFLFLLLAAGFRTAAADCRPVDLRCEYLTDPLGIDATAPRLSWAMEDRRAGARQSWYDIAVGTDSARVAAGVGDAWLSGAVLSGRRLVVYKGSPLRPFTKYYWRLVLGDSAGEASAPAMGSFEMGMMSREQWRGAWISDGKDKSVKPAPYFRTEFTAGRKIVSARAYIAVAGLYELSINGRPVGDHRLDPMYTRFDRRLLYVTYDVTAAVREGRNCVGVLLGNGWYNHQSTAVWNFDKAPWRNRPAFCMDLRVTYDDGTVETVTTGKNWKTALGPVVFNSIYTGEHYDARKEWEGWDRVGFVDTAWREVVWRSAPAERLFAQAMAPIRAVEVLHAKTLTKIADTDYVFDMGRNIAGVSRISIAGEEGTVVRVVHGERLGEGGHVDQGNINVHYRPVDDSDPFQTDIYVLGKGAGVRRFMPKFGYKGFQYIEVFVSRPVPLEQGSVEAVVMHSDVAPVGHIASGNPTIDKIWTATNNSYLSNLFGYPTDCPQREKNGWTGDAAIASETGLYNFDGVTVYEKWLADHRDEQQPNGVLPSIVPTDGWGYEWGNGPDWTSTIAIIPWNLYLFYGDTTALSRCYGNIRRYVEHIDELYPSGLTSWGLGDWIPVKTKTPVELTSTCYYYADVMILAKAAALFGMTADEERYRALAGKIRSAFTAKYWHPAKGVYDEGAQTQLSVPLYWGIVPDSIRSKAAAALDRRVAADNYHLDVGLLGTKAILDALSDNGYAETAYRLAAQESYPSWGWWIVNGATTLYENWPIDAKSDISMNHIMFGQIGAWLYRGLGGIRGDEAAPGFKHVIIEPHFVAGLDHFEAEHRGPYGMIRCAWRRGKKAVGVEVTVPANSRATVVLPGRKVEVGAGSYRWELNVGSR
jgi:alpha-L-rhamnosidase